MMDFVFSRGRGDRVITPSRLDVDLDLDELE
jgi:hypothetical protein